MYEAFFSLEDSPFVLTPDPRFLLRSKGHHEILGTLLYGITSQKGLMALIGDVGTGKTTLCRALLRELPKEVQSALVLNPHLSDAELVATILDDLGVDRKGTTKGELMGELSQHLLAAGGEGRTVVVILDEAQQMSVDALEQIRLLSTLETATRKLLQIVLVGQPELEEKLARRELRQLDQRISIRCHLKPLSRKDTLRYIEHRLRVAGLPGALPFSRPAMARIFRYTQGIPRVINMVCDRALMAAFSERAREVTPAIARRAIRNLEGETRKRRRLPRPAVPWARVGRTSAAASLGGLVVLGGIAAAAYWNGRGGLAELIAGAATVTTTPSAPTAPTASPSAPSRTAAAPTPAGSSSPAAATPASAPEAPATRAAGPPAASVAPKASSAQAPATASTPVPPPPVTSSAPAGPAKPVAPSAPGPAASTPSSPVAGLVPPKPIGPSAGGTVAPAPSTPAAGVAASAAVPPVPAAPGAETGALPRDGTRSLVVQLLRLWGVHDDFSSAAVASWPTSADGTLDLAAVAARYQLTATTLPATTLPELRAIGLPAIVEVRDRGGRRPLMLRRITDDAAALLTVSGDEVRFSNGSLEAAWTHAAWFVWRNVDFVPVDPNQELTPTVLTTLALRLQKLGHLTPPLPAGNTERFQTGVRRFQRATGLTEDGIVGPRTTLALSRVIAGRFGPTILDPGR